MKKSSLTLPALQEALTDLHKKYFCTDEHAGDGERARAWYERAKTPSATLFAEASAHAQRLLACEATWSKVEQDDYFGCLYALAQCKDDAFLMATTQSLGRKSPVIVARACFVLGHAKEARAVPMLLSLLDDDAATASTRHNALITADVVWALGMIRDARAVRALHKLWTRGVALEQVAQALARLAYLDSLPFLLMGLTHPSTRVRLYTAGAMATIASAHEPHDVQASWSALIPRVEVSLADIFVPVRVLAACLLAQLGRPFSNMELRQLLEMHAGQMNPMQGFFAGQKGVSKR